MNNGVTNCVPHSNSIEEFILFFNKRTPVTITISNKLLGISFITLGELNLVLGATLSLVQRGMGITMVPHMEPKHTARKALACAPAC